MKLATERLVMLLRAKKPGSSLSASATVVVVVVNWRTHR